MIGVAPRRLAALVVTAIALVVLLVPLFAGLGRMDLEGDEAIYAGVVERMLAGGSWASPPGDNGPFLEKPPLRFWMVASVMSAGLLKPTEGGHRAVDTILGAAAILYAFVVARRLGGLAAGVGAVFLVIAQRDLLFEHGLRSGTMEPLLVLAYCGAVAHLLWWADGGRPHAYAVAGWLAVAILDKFVAAAPLAIILVLAVAVVPSWRARAVADRRTWLIAAALGAVITAPWFVYQTARHGKWFWADIVGVHVLARIGSALDPAHVKPWWYYPDRIAGSLGAIWEYVVAGIVVMAWRARERKDPAALLVALWLVVPVALFSLATSKLGHYVHPALLALAIIGGQAFSAVAALFHGILRRAPFPPRARAIAGAVAVAAALAALAIAVILRGSIAVGGRIYGPTSPIPAVLVALAAFVVWAGYGRLAAAVLVIPMIAADVDLEYALATIRARGWGRYQGALADCVKARLRGRPASFHVYATRGLGRDEQYYFRRVGLVEEPEWDTRRLAARLAQTTDPQVISVDQYRRVVLDMAAWPPEAQAATAVTVLPHRQLVVILQGDARACSSAARRNP